MLTETGDKLLSKIINFFYKLDSKIPKFSDYQEM